MISVATLTAAGLAPRVAAIFAGPLAAACARFQINTPVRQGAFVGQCWVESNGFTELAECLDYRSAERICAVFPREVPTLDAAAPLVGDPGALARAVYDGRLGNAPGTADGWTFRGRGLCGLTGRAAYAACAAGTGRPYVDHPDLLEAPDDACLSAAWFWSARGCNVPADAGNVDAVTRAFNGPAMLGAAERRARTALATRAFA